MTRDKCYKSFLLNKWDFKFSFKNCANAILFLGILQVDELVLQYPCQCDQIGRFLHFGQLFEAFGNN